MKTAITLLFTLAATIVSSAQERSGVQNADTLSLRRMVFPGPENSFWLAKPAFPTNLADATPINELPPAFLRTAFLSQPLVFEKRPEFLSTLKLTSQTYDRFQFVRAALGYAQAAGTAYMAYRVLKKYGFMH